MCAYFILALQVKRIMRNKIIFHSGKYEIYLNRQHCLLKDPHKVNFNPLIRLEGMPINEIIELSDDEDCIVINNKKAVFLSTRTFYNIL